MKEFLFVVVLIGVFCKASTECDTSTTARVNEGNIGQSSTFSWLGVLKIHLRKPKEEGIALTGLVLIKPKYALINAHDVSQISEKALKEDGQAMFVADTDAPWYCKTKSYTVHPEYESRTLNTIAVVELDLESADTYPLRPICWSTRMTLNTSTYLYVTGYTDENKLLEKVIYRVEYTQKSACTEFYDKAGLADQERVPTHYLCGYSPFNHGKCVWDNAMALVSNASKYFTLLGFSTRGPGCSAPARYIDLQRYYQWMERSTSDEGQMYDDDSGDMEVGEMPKEFLRELFRRRNLKRSTDITADAEKP